jgi:hypothetical protein
MVVLAGKSALLQVFKVFLAAHTRRSQKTADYVQ